jgi:hypothetical protein
MEAVKEFQDDDNGGHGGAPKFPNFSFLEWSIEQMLEGMIDKTQGEHTIKTIEAMLMGGVNDHARGGIHRYSIDEAYTVPHFEKMLYDQAGLLKVLSKASLIYPSPLVYDTLINTLDYLESEMFSDQNYFFSAQDADSEGVEGLYFTYSQSEFEDIINRFDDEDETLSKNSEKIKKWFNINEIGNYDQSLNVISLNQEFKDEIFTQNGWEIVRKVRKAILEDRRDRIPPKTDNKGIASWNFQIVSALCDVIQYCQIDVIRNMSLNLLTRSLEGMYDAFITSKDSQGMRIRQSTTKKISLPYLENYVFFAESQIRAYEVTGNSTFKDNFYETIQFIQREFVQDNQIFTRAILSNDTAQYPNLAVTAFDASYKSPASTLIKITRRAATLFSDSDILTPIEGLKEELIHEALKNPINSGEALRALTYPTDVYRVVKCPRSWLENSKFVQFIPYFQPRFILDYNDNEEGRWEICTSSECELTGLGLDDFLNTLTPKDQNTNKQ